MDVNVIFSHLDENNFLTHLAKVQNILIVGDTSTLDAFQYALDIKSLKKETFYYQPVINQLTPEFDIDKSIPLTSLSAVIVASVDDEAALFGMVSDRFLTLIPDTTPILKLFSDVFVNFLIGCSLLRMPSKNIAASRLSYGIVTTPRSGSTFLCSLMESTGVCGNPTEHLRQASATLAIYCKFDYIQALHRLMDPEILKNGVFGTKFISHFLSTFEKAEFDFDAIFTKCISKFIYLKRSDKVAQAVSFYLARRTETWHITGDINKEEYTLKLNQIALDDDVLESVHENFLELKAEEEYLDNLLDAYEISPFVLEYEELLKDPQKWVALVLDFLGIAEGNQFIDEVKASTKTLRSEQSEQIANSYRQKYLHLGFD